MKNFYGIFATVAAAVLITFFVSFIIISKDGESGRPYRVEISRLAEQIEDGENADLSKCEYVNNVVKYDGNTAEFLDADCDFIVKEIDGFIYRFDYDAGERSDTLPLICLAVCGAFTLILIICLMIYIKCKILSPFRKLTNVPYELSKGNLTLPLKENKTKLFGRFIWGIDILRQNIEEQKSRELRLQKDKKTLLLSISHDIKTPLSAIKLYSKSLSKGLYTDKEKQKEIAESINAKADEIEDFISQIIRASGEDFLNLEVKNGEFYLSQLINAITAYYGEKLSLLRTDFIVGKYTECILKGDLDRSIEVIQNIIENAVKYGDGHYIKLDFSAEEDCRLITITNSGCNLSENEMPHIFDSFWRGSNTGSKGGSGLGLYICRRLMSLMGGDIFAERHDDEIMFTAVFTLA